MSYIHRNESVFLDNGMFEQFIVDCESEMQAATIAAALNDAARWRTLAARVAAGETFTFYPPSNKRVFVSVSNGRRDIGRAGETVSNAFDEACNA